MSAIALLLAAAIAFVATLLWAAVSGSWDVRACAAMFVFAITLLLAPLVVHA